MLFGTVGGALQHIVLSGEWFLVLMHMYVLFANRLLFHGPYETLDITIRHRRELVQLGNRINSAFAVPSLRKLRIRGRTQHCTRLLNFLDLAELSELTVEATFLGRTEVQDAFATAFASKLAALGPANIYRVDLHSGDDRSVWLQGFDADGNHKVTLVLFTTEQYDEEDVLAALLKKCQSSFDSVRALICDDLDLSDTSWMAVFSAFPNVEDLTLKLIASDVLTALGSAIRPCDDGDFDDSQDGDEAHEQTVGTTGDFVFPRLLSLTVCSLVDIETDPYGWEEESFNILFDLEEYLEARARLNASIARIRIVNCTESGNPSYNAKALQDLVETVAWV